MSNPKSREPEEVQQNLTPEQVKGQEQMERLDEAREIAERIKEGLAGLKYRPASPIETGGGAIITSERIGELTARKKSVDWLLSKFEEDKIGKA